jgi:hypothetical protein
MLHFADDEGELTSAVGLVMMFKVSLQVTELESPP